MTKAIRPDKYAQAQAQEILKQIWLKAYKEGFIELDFPKTASGELRAKKTYAALENFRRKIAKKKLEHIGLYEQIQAVRLSKKGSLTRITLTKVEVAISASDNLVLGLVDAFPDLDLTTPLEAEAKTQHDDIDNIMKSFTKKVG